MKNTSYKPDIALLIGTFFWGITFPLLRISVRTLSPAQTVFIRFLIATLLMSPLVFYRVRRTSRTTLLNFTKVGLALGCITWASYQAQTIGLVTVESGRAAFITGSAVVLIPLFSPLFGLKMPGKLDFVAALGVLLGLYFLTGATGQGIGTGELWVFLCAFTYALHVQFLQKWVKGNADAVLLAFFQFVGVLICSGLLMYVQEIPVPQFDTQTLAGLVVCAVFATIGSTWIQTRYQRDTSPERTALIFSLEPVFAAGFGYFLLDEKFSFEAWVGCSIILFSIVGIEWLKLSLSGAEESVS